MITIKKLFWNRLSSGWKYQYSVLKAVVDWIVALYIVIPYLGLFINTYLNWWKHIPPEFNSIPLNAFLGIVLLFAWSGTLRIFVEDADQIFLFQNKAWIKGIIKYSVAYYIFFNLLMSWLFCLVLAPFFLLLYHFSYSHFVWFVLSTFLLRASLGILKQLLELRLKGWKQGFAKIAFFLIAGWYFRLTITMLINDSILFFFSNIFIFIILWFLIYRRVSISGALLEDIEINEAAKLKFTNVLLKYKGTYAKKPVNFRTRPLLFRNSNTILKKRTPENGLIELCLKSTLRHGANLRFYFEVIGAYALMLSAFPSDWKWLLWCGSIPFLISVVKMYWLESANSPFVSLFPIRTEIQLNAAIRSLFSMALPGEIILFLFVTLQTQEWLYALILFPSGLLLSHYLAKKLAIFS